MRTKILTVILLLIAAVALAARPELPKDGAGVKVQGHAPTGSKDVTLTVASQTVNMTNDLSWSQYAPGACKFRTMSTATKAGIAHTLPATTWNTRNVNATSPFLNFTGCTSGELQRQ